MERERRPERQLPRQGGDPGPEQEDGERLCAAAEAILSVADQVLDSIHPVDAETYLQQNRQRGGQ